VVIDGVKFKIPISPASGFGCKRFQNTQYTACQLFVGSTGYCAVCADLAIWIVSKLPNWTSNEIRATNQSVGPNGYNDIFNLKIHDSRISVNPFGFVNNGSAPNIALELWAVTLWVAKIYNCYVDNTISLVNSNAIPPGIQTIRVHDNTLD